MATNKQTGDTMSLTVSGALLLDRCGQLRFFRRIVFQPVYGRTGAMKEIIKQNCPLCESPADYYFVDFGKRKYFECSECTLFQVTRRAEKIILQSPQQWRLRFSQQARRAPEEHALVIRVPQMVRGKGGPTQSISAEFVSWSDLPQ